MKKLVLMLTVLVFVTSTFAVAADQKALTKVPVQMTDAEMAEVVGGTKGPPPIGSGYYLDQAIWSLISFTYSLEFLSIEEQHLIENKLQNIRILFWRCRDSD